MDAAGPGGTGRRTVDQEDIGVTAAARAAVEQLTAEHGPLMFIESHGCCDNSAPMCFPQGDFLVGSSDVQVAQVAGCPYYVDARTLRFRNAGTVRLRLRLDIEPGYSDGMSLGPPGSHFVIRPDLTATPGPSPTQPAGAGTPTEPIPGGT